MKILIMAGGTGGHVFPALSIARELMESGATVEWLGTRAGLEAKLVPEQDIPIHYIAISGLRGKGMLKKILAPFAIARAVIQACWRVFKIRPQCVLGMGGFVTGPGGIASWLLRKPLVIHEQNAIAGFTNLMLMPFANIVLEAFPGSYRRKEALDNSWLSRMALSKPEKVQMVGNPVRQSICDIPPQTADDPQQALKILVLGGSLGAVAINELMPKVLAAFPAQERPQVWHQCGERHIEQSLAAYASAGLEPGGDCRVVSFINDMAAAYAWADLVICRAGALTVSEVACAGRASILVPYPHAVDDHQTENARYLEQEGAAIVVQQHELSENRLKSILDKLLNSRGSLANMGANARRMGHTDASLTVSKLCLGACYG